jgi:hypothetical protein
MHRSGRRGSTKKLIEAARFILSDGASAVEDSWSDLKKFGVTDDEIARLQGDEQKPLAPDFFIWPENWRAIQIMDAMATQWRSCFAFSSIVFLGWDYSALDAVDRRLQKHPQAIEPEPHELFNQLRVVEQLCIAHLNRGT